MALLVLIRYGVKVATVSRASGKDRRDNSRVFRRRWFRILVLLIICVAGPIALYWIIYPNSSYRYRLNVAIELDGKVYSGSSVIEVMWHSQPALLPEMAPFSPTLRGQATVVDLGDRGVVIATLYNGSSYGRAGDGAYGALWLLPLAFGKSTSAQDLREILLLHGSRELTDASMPRLLWFPKPLHLQSVKVLTRQNKNELLGLGAGPILASVEMTHDRVVVDLEKTLPSLIPFKIEKLETSTPLLRNGLTPSMFFEDTYR
jgi:hypothetical protein